MSLIVEDGTGLATAQSYASVASLQAHTPYGQYSIPVGATTQQIEAALIRATSALDGLYASRWPGRRLTAAQALAWPRIDAYDLDGWELTGLPNPIRLACMEAALVELSSTGALTKAQERGGRVIREKVGPVETEYERGAPGVTSYQNIETVLLRILRLGGARLARG